MAEVRRDDWDVLGLAPGADAEAVHRAYRQRQALYSADSLATYSLLSESERQRLRERVEDAYHRILEVVPAAAPLPGATPEPVAPAELPPDPVASPGAYLRHQRESAGLSLEDLASRTKIRAPVLDDIETERWERLPADVYVRGFVVQISRVLELPEPEAAAAHYLRRRPEEHRT